MEIKILNTASEVSDFVAERILEYRIRNEHFTWGVPTGRTMDAIYYKLAQKAHKSSILFNNVKAFAVDEYIGLAESSGNSYKAYLKHHLYDPLSFRDGNTFIPNVSADDMDKEASHYEKLIVDSGGLDLLMLGVGLNGHIGLNEPGSSLDSRTRVVALTSSTMNSNKVLFRSEDIPKTGITMGIGTMLESSECFMVATGDSKADIVQKIINGDVNSKVPATAIKEHKNALFILDKHAAKYI